MILWLFTAFAGDVVGSVALDHFAAYNRSDLPGSGQPEEQVAAELGMRIRGDLHEWDDRLEIAVDYRGREPLTTGVRNATHRLVYALRAEAAVVEDRLDLGVGRFIAPSAILLPVDGAYARVHLTDHTRLQAFGGRRGFSTARRNLAPNRLLPAAGLSAEHVQQRVQLIGLLSWAEDEIVVANGGEAFTEDVPSLNGQVRGLVLPHDDLAIGASGAFAQSASYVLGPSWAEADIEAEAMGLFQGLVWASYSPGDFRFDADVHQQHVQVFRTAILEGGETLEFQEPNHTDVRLRGGYAPLQRGWIRLDGRFRRRPDRQEIRTGLRLDANNLEVPGLYLRGSAYVDNVLGADQADDVGTVDRLFWTASAGYKQGIVDVRAGASFIERAATPVSGRQQLANNPGAPTNNVDLAPFVLEAQNIAFVRGFFTSKRWFAGVDLEANLNDTEFRGFLQVGYLVEAGW